MTERVGVIARVRALAVGIAKAWVDQQKAEQPAKADEPEPASAKNLKMREASAGVAVIRAEWKRRKAQLRDKDLSAQEATEDRA